MVHSPGTRNALVVADSLIEVIEFIKLIIKNSLLQNGRRRQDLDVLFDGNYLAPPMEQPGQFILRFMTSQRACHETIDFELKSKKNSKKYVALVLPVHYIHTPSAGTYVRTHTRAKEIFRICVHFCHIFNP